MLIHIPIPNPLRLIIKKTTKKHSFESQERGEFSKSISSTLKSGLDVLPRMDVSREVTYQEGGNYVKQF